MKNITLVFMLIGIIINIGLGQIALSLKLPVFLDSIGTIFVALLMGPWKGMAVGFLSNVVWGFLTVPVLAAFAPVAMVIGFTAGILARRRMFSSLPRVLLSGVVITIALTIVATPILTYRFSGFTGAGADSIVAYLSVVERRLAESVIWAVVGTNLIDKIISSLAAWALVCHLPAHIKEHFPDVGKVGQ